MIPKFRMWIVNKDRWFRDKFVVQDNGQVWSIINDQLYEEFTEEVKSGLLILMPSTGVKDNNDREIFVGDIVRDDTYIWEVMYGPYVDSDHPAGPPVFGLYLDLVKFGNKLYDQGDRQDDFNADVEVIGNIYENPELMEGGDCY